METMETDEEFCNIFSSEPALSLIIETGFATRAISQLKLSDYRIVRSALIYYHCILKVKSAMDQYCSG
jgi:hypothetical protein